MYEFTVTHRLADGTVLTESEVIAAFEKMPPLEVTIPECEVNSFFTKERGELNVSSNNNGDSINYRLVHSL